jgi:hypothetical protein
MSHWAEIDKNNIVVRVLVGDNNEADEGEAFMNSLGGTWIKTSFNGTIRGKFAAIGDLYDKKKDVFVSQRSDLDKQIDAIIADREAKHQAILDRLGLTADEAQLLLGGN